MTREGIDPPPLSDESTDRQLRIQELIEEIGGVSSYFISRDVEENAKQITILQELVQLLGDDIKATQQEAFTRAAEADPCFSETFTNASLAVEKSQENQYWNSYEYSHHQEPWEGGPVPNELILKGEIKGHQVEISTGQGGYDYRRGISSAHAMVDGVRLDDQQAKALWSKYLPIVVFKHSLEKTTARNQQLLNTFYSRLQETIRFSEAQSAEPEKKEKIVKDLLG